MTDARINEYKLVEYLDSFINWNTFEGTMIRLLLKYMSDDEIKDFREKYELIELNTE